MCDHSQVWIAPVNAIVPGLGLHIWWYGLWMQRAEGISLNQLSYITRKTFVEATIMDLLQVWTSCRHVDPGVMGSAVWRLSKSINPRELPYPVT